VAAPAPPGDALTTESAWSEYRWQIAGVVAVVGFQATIIGALLVERRRRLQAQHKTHAADQFSRSVMASLAAEVAVLDTSGLVIAVNDAWSHVASQADNPAVRARQGDVYVQTVRASGLAATEAELVVSLVVDVLSGRQIQATGEFTWGPEGGRRWSQLRLRRFDNPAGGVVIAHVDVSALRRAETELQRYLHDLSHLTTIASVGEIAATVAHELNQPLTAILTNAQALRRMVANGAPSRDDVLEVLDDIIGQDKRAGEVLNRMRRVLKKDRFDLVPVDVNALVADVTRLMAHDSGRHQIPIQVQLAPNLPPIRGDRVQLQQVLLNLIQNAVHATGDHRRSGRVVVSTTLTESGVRIAVSDSGPGIAGEVNQVFQPFYSTKKEGLGMGLSISRTIVELHGGEIEARNLPTGGAEFSVTFPVEGVAA
jgi:two-component system sensor kinase FixL